MNRITELKFIKMPSTVISTMDYVPSSSTLIIKYVSGEVYHYKEVPEQVYKELKAAGSKGRYLNHHIKHKFDFERINKESSDI